MVLVLNILGFCVVDVWSYSVVGLSFDFVVLNLTKHSSYLIYNASLYFSSTIQKQYYEKYGYGQVTGLCFLLEYLDLILMENY